MTKLKILLLSTIVLILGCQTSSAEGDKPEHSTPSVNKTTSTTPPIQIDCVVLNVESNNPSISSDFAAHSTSSRWELCKQPGDKAWEPMITRLLDDTKVNGKVTLRKYFSLIQEHKRTKSKKILKKLQAIRRRTHPKEETSYRAGQSRNSASMTLRGKDGIYGIDFDLQYSGRLIRDLREKTVQDGEYEDQSLSMPGRSPVQRPLHPDANDAQGTRRLLQYVAKTCHRMHKGIGDLSIRVYVDNSELKHVYIHGPSKLSATKKCMETKLKSFRYEGDFAIKSSITF